MKADVKKNGQVIYDVYDYCGLYDSFDTLKDARVAFKWIKHQYGQGKLVKRQYECIEIKTETIIQSA